MWPLTRAPCALAGGQHIQPQPCSILKQGRGALPPHRPSPALSLRENLAHVHETHGGAALVRLDLLAVVVPHVHNADGQVVQDPAGGGQRGAGEGAIDRRSTLQGCFE